MREEKIKQMIQFKEHISVYLMSGIRLQGIIAEQDEHSICLVDGTLIMFHAIASIK